MTDPARAYLGSLSPKGRQTMVERLRAVAKLLDVPYEAVVWHEFRFQHVDFIRQRLLDQGRSPATVNLTLAALRGIARYARNLNLMSAEEYDRIRDVKGAKGSRLPAGRAATSGELAALVRVCLEDRSPAGMRDAALLAVLYVEGAPLGAGRPRPGRLDRRPADATRAVRQGRQGTPGPAGGRRGRRCRGLAVAARRARGAAPLQR